LANCKYRVKANSPYAEGEASLNYIVCSYHHVYGSYQFTVKLITLIIANGLDGKEFLLFSQTATHGYFGRCDVVLPRLLRKVTICRGTFIYVSEKVNTRDFS
jgi:hypothetical protein